MCHFVTYTVDWDNVCNICICPTSSVDADSSSTMIMKGFSALGAAQTCVKQRTFISLISTLDEAVTACTIQLCLFIHTNCDLKQMFVY